MARPEKELEDSYGALPRFAEDLRELRRNVPGLTYRAMSKKANYSPSVLSEAAAGRKLPTLEVTRAYVAACGGDVETWDTRWQAVATELNPTGTQDSNANTDLTEAGLAQETTPAAGEGGASSAAGRPVETGKHARRRRDALLVGSTLAVALGIAAVVVLVLLNGGDASPPQTRGEPAAGEPPAGAACSQLPGAKACFDSVRGVFWVRDLPPPDNDHTAVYWTSNDGRQRGDCHNMLTSDGPWVTCPHPAGLQPHRAPVTFQAAIVDEDTVRERGPMVDEAR